MASYSLGKQQKKGKAHFNLGFVIKSDVPGVGTYNSQHQNTAKLHRSPAYVIGKTQRTRNDQTICPGPGSYNLLNQTFFVKLVLSRGGKAKDFIQQGKKKKDQKVRVLAQAGKFNCIDSYTISHTKSSKKYTFGVKNEIMKLDKNLPGPGFYQPSQTTRQKSISFQVSKRPSLQKNAKEKIPGPASYNFESLKQTKNKFSFPQRDKFFQDNLQFKEKTKIPGPGLYESLNINRVKKQATAAKFSQSSRPQLTSKTVDVGPGSYDPKKQPRSKAFVPTIGNSSKGLQINNTNPGPAHYLYNQKNLVKKQPCIMQIWIQCSFSKSVRDEKSKDTLIGPGTYNVDYHQKSFAFTMRSRFSEQKVSKAPGPLSYSPRYQSNMRKTQTISIGKAKKTYDDNKQTPGPGSYSNPSHLVSKSKTFYFPKDARKEKTNSNPGPGTYEIKK